MATRELDRIEGVVSAIVPGGQALIRDDKGVVLARGGLPGERVVVDVRRVQRRVRHGVVVQVLDPSPSRVSPTDCALHPRCGGCDLLSLAPAAAAEARVGIVKDALLRVGHIAADVVDRALAPLVTPTTDDERADARRRRARFVIVGGKPTFSAAESHERVAIERCPALHPALDAALALVPNARLADRMGLRLAVDDQGHVSAALDGGTVADAARLVATGAARGALALDNDEEVGRSGEPLLYGEIAPGFGTCASDAATFTQATRFGGLAILRAVMDAVGAVGPLEGMRVLELFAGAGHLTVPMLQGGAEVLAIEGAPRAVRFLEQNTLRFDHRARVRRSFIDGHLVVNGPFDVVVADPPRTGIPGFAPLIDAVGRACPRPPVWVMVSCDVATGARDIAVAQKKGYVLERLVPIDAFPRTSHVEWVAKLVPRGKQHG